MFQHNHIIIVVSVPCDTEVLNHYVLGLNKVKQKVKHTFVCKWK